MDKSRKHPWWIIAACLSRGTPLYHSWNSLLNNSSLFTRTCCDQICTKDCQLERASTRAYHIALPICTLIFESNRSIGSAIHMCSPESGCNEATFFKLVQPQWGWWSLSMFFNKYSAKDDWFCKVLLHTIDCSLIQSCELHTLVYDSFKNCYWYAS